MPSSSTTRRSREPSPRPGTTSRPATRIAGTTSSGRCSRRRSCSWSRRSSSEARAVRVASRCKPFKADTERSCGGPVSHAADAAQLPHRRASRAAHRRAGRAALRAPGCLPARFPRASADRGGLAGPTRGAAGDAARQRPYADARAGLERLRRRQGAARPDGGARPAGPHTLAATSPSSPRRSCSARARGRSGVESAPQPIRKPSCKSLQDLNPGAPVVHEDYGVGRYVGLAAHGGRRPAGRVPGAGVPGRRPRVCARPLAASGQPLHRRRPRERAAAQARHRPVGQGAQARGRADPRRRRGAAGSVRAPQGAAGPEAPARARPITEASPRPSRSRRPKIRPKRSARCSPIWRASGRWTASSAATSASARPKWRCARRSWPTQAGKQVAVLAPDDAARAAASDQLPRPLRRLAGAVAALSRFGNAKETQATIEGIESGTDRHRHRDASAAALARALQGSRAAHHR